jgi:hypothetical protein
MAKALERSKKKSAGKASGKPKKTRARIPMKEGANGIGHNSGTVNIVELRKKAEPEFKRLFQLQDDMDAKMAEFRTDFKDLYETIANKTGKPRAIIRETFNDMKREQRRQKRASERDASQQQHMDELCLALAGTPFGVYLHVDERAKDAKRAPSRDEAPKAPEVPFEQHGDVA